MKVQRMDGQIYKKTSFKEKMKSWWNRYGIGYAFLLPYIILFIIFTVIPVAVALGVSCTNYNMLQSPSWQGISNYKLLFTDDDIFITAIKNTFFFAFISGPIGYIMSFFAAWVINQLKFRKGFALAFYAPSITSGVAILAIFLCK